MSVHVAAAFLGFISGRTSALDLWLVIEELELERNEAVSTAAGLISFEQKHDA
jgi:hypothetical protein